MDNFESGKVKLRNSEIAYILFTSGTTGYPKGVIIKKSSLNHYINWLVKKIALKNVLIAPRFHQLVLIYLLLTFFYHFALDLD